MQMQNMFTSGSLMEIINVLGNHDHFEFPLQLGYGNMGRIGHRGDHLSASLVIEP